MDMFVILSFSFFLITLVFMVTGACYIMTDLSKAAISFVLSSLSLVAALLFFLVA